MKRLIISIAAIVLCVILFRNSTYGREPVLMQAMEDELQRSIALRLDNEAAPYFISYLVRDSNICIISADSGAITKNEVNRKRTIDTTVKVGSYDFDNSHFTATQSSLNTGLSGLLSLDDNYGVLRRQIWLETDGAYKSALSTLAEKKAYLQNRIQVDSLPDFTKGGGFSEENPCIPLTIEKRDEKAGLVGKLARLLMKNDRILKSSILLKMSRENIYYANSEGVKSIEPDQSCRLIITASTKADDGMPLKNFRIYTFASPDEIPGEEKLARDVEEMTQELMSLRKAPVAGDYSGPVIFEKQAAAEILARGMVRLLTAKRSSESNISLFEKRARKMENPLLKKIGLKLMGESADLRAEPMKSTYEGTPLLGSYDVDDEGTKAQNVSIVKGGFLRDFMLSRSPVQGFSKSNGHFRGSTTAPSVLELSSSKALGAGELEKKLMSGIRDEGLKYGYIVRSILPPELADDEDGGFASLVLSRSSLGPSEFELSKPVMIYRVYPDGREELVRGAGFDKMNINFFKNISGISDDSFIYNYTVNFSDLRYDGGFSESGGVESDIYATIITPSILFSGADVIKSQDSYLKPPIVSSPIRGK